MALKSGEVPVQSSAQDPVQREIFRINISGVDDEFLCLPGETVLAAMSRQGSAGIPVGCRGGGCGVCRVRVLSGRYRCGTMSRIHVSDADRKGGYGLACRLYPQSDLSIMPAPHPGVARGRL